MFAFIVPIFNFGLEERGELSSRPPAIMNIHESSEAPLWTAKKKKV